MIKHIKFQAKAIGPDFNTIEVVILSQTHRGVSFGARSATATFTHDGFTLESCDCPASYRDDYTRVFVQGRVCQNDGTKMVMSLAKYTKFKAAVLAYNKTFAAPARVASSPCTFVIG